jgi:hypothetical protein
MIEGEPVLPAKILPAIVTVEGEIDPLATCCTVAIDRDIFIFFKKI